MLIETPFKLQDVITLKLVGGDEVIGRLQDEHTDQYVELYRPVLVMMGQQGFGLIPYLLTAGPDTKVKIGRDHVITIAKTLEPVAKEYQKQTSSIVV
jgi:hypothetical protein